MKEKFLNALEKMVPKWLLESNRLKHFYYAIPIGFVFTILCVLGAASAMEFKDAQYGNKWDWLDWTATMLGGLVGQLLFIGLNIIAQ